MEEKIKKEIIERLKILESKGLMKTVRKEFETNETVYLSENHSFCGALYWLNSAGGCEEEEKIVKEFEEKNNVKVYHVLKGIYNVYGETMELLDLFFISNYEEEWEVEKEEMKNNIAFIYCYNKTYTDYSEYGSTYYRCLGGGIVRA